MTVLALIINTATREGVLCKSSHAPADGADYYRAGGGSSNAARRALWLLGKNLDPESHGEAGPGDYAVEVWANGELLHEDEHGTEVQR